MIPLPKTPLRKTRPARRERGFALLIVLWLLVPVSTLLILMSGAARTDSQLTTNLRAAAILRAAADGGIQTALPTLFTSTEIAPMRMQIAGTDVTVEVASLSGLVNPNLVTPEFMRALLVRLGAPAAQAERIALAMLDWRLPGQTTSAGRQKFAEYQAAGLDYAPPGAPFESADEMRLVLGMTPGLFATLRPYLNLYTEGSPNAALAAPPVLAALQDVGSGQPRAERPTTFTITAQARGAAGLRAARQMTVRIGNSPNERPWRVLAWEDAPSS